MNCNVSNNTSHKLGQYFTTHPSLQRSVTDLIQNNPLCILEPSCGRGDLVSSVLEHFPETSFDLYEIDETINILPCIQRRNIHFTDFLTTKIDKKYKTIIGNPPFVRVNTGNLYIEFIEKCYHLLEENGELIFIVPSDFLKVTMSASLISCMMKEGTFTHIIHPHNEKLFEHANIDVIVFRYCKNVNLPNTVKVNNILKHIVHTNGILTFTDKEPDNDLFCEYFEIYVGIVSGKESVFKHDALGTISVRNGEHQIDKYVLVENFPTENDNLNSYLLAHKTELMNRKIRKFTEKNWFEWGALRNFQKVKSQLGKNCLYVHTLTRSQTICFQGTVDFFGGGLIILIPKIPIHLDKMASFINSSEFTQNYMYSGRFKIGHKQLSHSRFNVSHFT